MTPLYERFYKLSGSCQTQKGIECSVWLHEVYTKNKQGIYAIRNQVNNYHWGMIKIGKG